MMEQRSPFFQSLSTRSRCAIASQLDCSRNSTEGVRVHGCPAGCTGGPAICYIRNPQRERRYQTEVYKRVWVACFKFSSQGNDSSSLSCPERYIPVIRRENQEGIKRRIWSQRVQEQFILRTKTRSSTEHCENLCTNPSEMAQQWWIWCISSTFRYRFCKR